VRAKEGRKEGDLEHSMGAVKQIEINERKSRSYATTISKGVSKRYPPLSPWRVSNEHF